MNTAARRALLGLLAGLAPSTAFADDATPASAAAATDAHPQFWIGASIGYHLVATDFEMGELGRVSQPISPDSSLYSELRLVLDLTPAWSIELSGAHLPLGAGDETNDALDLGARVRYTFASLGIKPYLLLGAGSYANLQPDVVGGATNDDGTHWSPQGHYGVGIAPELADWLRLRVEVRHQISDGLGDAALAHLLVGMVGFDLRLAGGADEPEPEPEPVKAPEPEPEPVKAPEPEPEPVKAPEPEPVKAPVVVKCETIEFDEMVFFDFDQFTLRPAADGVLDEIAKTLGDRPDVRRIEIRGFADPTGTAAYNLKLSRKRAGTVRDALVKRGVAAGRLKTDGRGTANPMASNDTESGRAQNRRVAFHILQLDPSAACPTQGN